MFQFIIICGEYWPLYSNIFFSFRVSFLLTFSHAFFFDYLPCLANSAILFYPYVILAFIIEKFPSRSDNVFQISHFLATTYVTWSRILANTRKNHHDLVRHEIDGIKINPQCSSRQIISKAIVFYSGLGESSDFFQKSFLEHMVRPWTAWIGAASAQVDFLAEAQVDPQNLGVRFWAPLGCFSRLRSNMIQNHKKNITQNTKTNITTGWVGSAHTGFEYLFACRMKKIVKTDGMVV